MVSESSSYHHWRANEERRMAMAATHPLARTAHLELAARHAALAEGRQQQQSSSVRSEKMTG
jgi:hypothetical protein